MANLTIVVDDELLKKARMRALEDDTSVNAILRERLEEYAGGEDRKRKAIEEILESSKRSTCGSGGRRWTREELYERGRPR